jgi:hypothetical protein
VGEGIGFQRTQSFRTPSPSPPFNMRSATGAHNHELVGAPDQGAGSSGPPETKSLAVGRPLGSIQQCQPARPMGTNSTTHAATTPTCAAADTIDRSKRPAAPAYTLRSSRRGMRPPDLSTPRGIAGGRLGGRASGLGGIRGASRSSRGVGWWWESGGAGRRDGNSRTARQVGSGAGGQSVGGTSVRRRGCGAVGPSLRIGCRVPSVPARSSLVCSEG